MNHCGIYQRRECQRNSFRACFWENESFRCKFENMFCTHFEEKVILLKFVHYEHVFSLKVLFFYYLRVKSDRWMYRHLFLTNAFASIASVWIRPCQNRNLSAELNERLSSLAILHIHRDQEISVDNVITKFVTI